MLGLEIDEHLADDFSTVLVPQKVRMCKMEDYLKTDNAYRDIDLHSSVVMMLKEFIGLRTVGFLFAFRNGKPLSNSNILNRHLHPTLASSVGAAQEQGTTPLETMPSADSAIPFCERIMSQTI